MMMTRKEYSAQLNHEMGCVNEIGTKLDREMTISEALQKAHLSQHNLMLHALLDLRDILTEIRDALSPQGKVQ